MDPHDKECLSVTVFFLLSKSHDQVSVMLILRSALQSKIKDIYVTRRVTEKIYNLAYFSNTLGFQENKSKMAPGKWRYRLRLRLRLRNHLFRQRLHRIEYYKEECVLEIFVKTFRGRYHKNHQLECQNIHLYQTRK